jgi:hypothetical protein
MAGVFGQAPRTVPLRPTSIMVMRKTGLLAVVAVVTTLATGLVVGVVAAANPGVAVAATTASLAGVHRTASLPRPADVVRGRFVAPVALDGGVLTVVPAPAGDRPAVSRTQAAREVWASPVLQDHVQGPLGYGLVTISLRVKGVPHVTRLLAWVGFARSPEVANCPNESPGTAGHTPVLSGAALASSGEAAVVIGAAHGSPAVAYAAPSVLCDHRQPATLSRATEDVSVPWRALTSLANQSIRVRVTLPDCARLEGTAAGGSAQVSTVTVDAVVPDVHGHCAGITDLTEIVVFGPTGNPPGAPPPLVSASTLIRHAAVGPEMTAVAPPP